MSYDPKEIESRWQRIWEEEGTWVVPNPGQPGFDEERPKSYVLEMLPYPSGEPHVGHLKTYSVGDAIAHYRRRRGANVVHPMGYDAFGLPAENNAIQTGEHPRDATEKSIAAFREQFKRWGISIDWTREFGTHEPSYYRWTQWIFLKLFERGLAYRTEAPVQWCPNDATVLAHEQVIDGRCERCGTLVEQRQLEQWFFKITDYADRLLQDFRLLESWPENVLTMQRNWIGRSEGAEVVFRCEDAGIDFPVFTTRPDTLFGATFFVLAPEHPEVERLAAGTEHEAEVRDYVNAAARASVEDRAEEEREKTGVPLGREVTNPVNGERIPMFVADYVLMEYGTGAIMAVPAHDHRDGDFAKKFELPIRYVVVPAEIYEEAEGDSQQAAELAREAAGGGAFVEHSENERLINSGEFDGMSAEEAIEGITRWLEGKDLGEHAVNYRLRDWLVSRQRYWGAPIPIVYCERCGMVPVPEQELPVLLPDVDDYAPKGKSPLAAAEDWVLTECPSCGGEAHRETDTMDTFVDSSWYFLRYLDPDNADAPWDRGVAAYWMPVDQYIGGVEHAILHLMYARFFCKALSDMELLDAQEPFTNLFAQGMITREGAKMSKSRGNTVSPAEFVDRYGADSIRTYICFMGPPIKGGDWADEGVEGVFRFLSRVWRLGKEVSERTERIKEVEAPEDASSDVRELLAKAHWAIDKVSRDIDPRFQLNTAIAAVMELVNKIFELKDGFYDEPSGVAAVRFATATAASLIFPFAPHLGSEVYEWLTGDRVWEQPWPEADPELLSAETFMLVVQVNGKLRDRVEADSEAGEEELIRLARESENVQRHLDGKEIVKEIVVPGRLVNLVVR